ncbi:MAG TPA: galactose oxidase, partial [Verrucomicrobiales bacterium]|nr:galactose oxidase [Verrucomicrobiales bacterium]
SSGGTPFSGTGQFKLALVNGAGNTTYWSNDGTSTAGSEPTAAVALPVVNGLYLVPMGDATLPNMTAIPATVFSNADVRVRVWFNDGVTGSQQLSPDQRITSVGYAMMAGSLPGVTA